MALWKVWTTLPELNFHNRTLYHGDNLPFLRGMNSETVDLVATDPPFKKGRDFHATPDSLAAGARFEDRWSWDKDVHPDWVDSIKDERPAVWSVIEAARTASGDDMAAFLCWLGVRIMEMHRLLKPTGSLYLHIDHTAHAYVKTMFDAIFGKQQFRNEIVWGYTGPSNTKRWFPRKHDIILFYVKSEDSVFNRDAVRIPYHDETIARRGRVEGDRSIISASVENKGRRDTHEVLSKFGQGKVIEDWWADIPSLTNQSEKTGYPTQKPLALYERIIRASSNPGDLVLDPFCGCATTPVAAERLGRRWVGMDIWDGAIEQVRQRMEDNRQLIGDIPEIFYSTAPPVRTDDGLQAAPDLKLKLQLPEPPGPKMTHVEMKAFLIQNDGIVCRGCLRTFDDERYLDLDHNTPRSDGGINHISNRVLLCGPCNRAKSNTLTISGLRALNRQNGWMAKE